MITLLGAQDSVWHALSAKLVECKACKVHTCEKRQVRSMPSASRVPASAGSNQSSVLAAATAASLLSLSECCILPFSFLSLICSKPV